MINVYDFDKTIYDGDSTLDFYRFCLKNKPNIIAFLPLQILYFFQYLLGLITKTKFKEKFYMFLVAIPNIDQFVNKFWDKHEKKIMQWYFMQRTEQDIVISASPEFLLVPICQKIGMKKTIASRVDKNTGKYIGVNCYGLEKLKRLREVFPDEEIDNFYSDSLSDSCLAEIAKKSYLVVSGNLVTWKNSK